MTAGRQNILLIIFACFVLGFLMLPSLIVVVISFSADRYMSFPPQSWTLDWYRKFFSSPEWLDALSMSLRVAALTSFIATTVGTLSSLGLHGKQGRLWSALRSALLTPAIVPVILVAAGSFMLFARLHLDGRFGALVVVHSALALPFVVVMMSAAFQTYDFTLDKAARSLGASPLKCLFSVTLPQVKGSLGASALFAFLTSFDEAVVALFITGGSSATLAQRMFESLRDDLDPTIAAISALLITVTTCVFVIVRLFGSGRTQRATGVR